MKYKKLSGDMLLIRIKAIIELNELFFIESINPLVNFGKWYLRKPTTKEQNMINEIKSLIGTMEVIKHEK